MTLHVLIALLGLLGTTGIFYDLWLDREPEERPHRHVRPRAHTTCRHVQPPQVYDWNEREPQLRESNR